MNDPHDPQAMVDTVPPDAKAAAKRRKLPSSNAGNDGTEGGKSDSEGSYQQVKRPRTSQGRHPRGVPWFTMLERLKQYRVRHGTLNVPRILPDDQKLASWVHYQRYLFHHKTIAEERKAALDAIGFEWTIADSKVGNRVSWDQHLARLTAYKERFGDCLVPYTYKEDKSLAYWVSRQRKDNNKGLLPPDKVAKLNAIGFAWNPTLGRRWSKNKEQRSRTTNWDGQFEKLKALHELSAGGTDLRALIEQDKSLEAWMKNQRYLYSVKRMSQERIDKLDSIGFVFRIGISWNDYLVRLKNHKENHGSFDNIADPKLAEWVDCQRISYYWRELSKERVDQLNAVGFVWESEKVAASQEEWKKVMKQAEVAQQQPPALAPPKTPPKPMLYAKGPTALDEKMPALPGQGVADPSQEEMVKFLEEHVNLDVAATVPESRASLPDAEDAKNLQEYNIAIHLAGLAETTEPLQQQEGASKDEEQTNKLPAKPGTAETQDTSNEKDGGSRKAEEGLQANPVDIPEGGATRLPGQTEQEGGSSKPLGKENAKKGTSDGEGQEEVDNEEELSTQEKNVRLQEAIVSLREEKVKLQEERVKVQEEKLELRREIEAIRSKNETLSKQKQTEVTADATAASSEKRKELEDKVKENEDRMKMQAAQIKEHEEKIQSLLEQCQGVVAAEESGADPTAV